MQKRIPPMSATNNLILDPQDEDSKLTELEGALISKNLIFQKIYQLPKLLMYQSMMKIFLTQLNCSQGHQRKLA